jgi:type I restriction enzyme M protein
MANKKTFLEAKQEFDKKYLALKEFTAFIPVNQKLSEKYSIKNKKGEVNEEYYKWQFFYALVYSGLYQKDYLGCEVYFPKGNKNSTPIKLDGAIFDDSNWFDWYKKYYKNKNQEALDWLRNHLIGVIEFKNENSKDTEIVYNQQLKPAIKESESNFCLGILYDAERLYLFQRQQEHTL